MKRIYKYLISVIFIIACLCMMLLIPNESKAISYQDAVEMNEASNNKLDRLKDSHGIWTSDIWDKGSNPLRMRYPILLLRNDLYCVARSVPLRSSPKYVNSKYVKINGTSATDETGKTVDNYNNAVLAYILSKGTGGHANRNTEATFGDGQNHNLNDLNNFSDTQIALFMFINDWFDTVGREFGIAWSHASNSGVKDPAVQASNPAKYQAALDIVAQAKSDANNLGSGSTATVKNNTDKDNIKITYYTSNNTQYVKVGPFNWTYTGTLSSITVTGNNGAQPSLKYFGSDGNTEISMSDIKSSSNFYVAFRADTGMTSISSITGTVTAPGKSNITAELWFLHDADNVSQHVMLTDYSVTKEPDEVVTVPPMEIPLTLDFSVIKVDEEDNSIKLSNVGFKFYNSAIGKYIRINGSEIQYVDTIEQATELITDQNGRIELNGVLAGTYIAYETKNPNYGYIVDGNGVELHPSDGDQIPITNTPEFIRISGLVWEDIQSEKMSIRNDLYKLDDYDDKDVLVEGIEVRLIDRRTGQLVSGIIPGLGNDQVIQNPTYTDANGNYSFDYVSAADVENYYVEFEYDGLVYQSVIPHIENEEKGSKAAEVSRQEFNNRFATVERGNTELQAAAKDQNGNEQARVNYEVTSESTDKKRFLSMSSTENCEIVATTDGAGYTINLANRVNNEIKHINLGIYRRLQTDLSIRSEIAKVNVEINGYGHVYNYMDNTGTARGNQSIEDWNLGIRNYNTYKNAYERPVYKADAEYTNAQDPSRELRMAMTYEITVLNESQLYSKINQIVSYFNNNYTVNAIGTEVNDQGVVGGTVLSADNYTVEKYNDTFNRLVINTSAINQIIDPPTVAAPEGQEKVTQQKIYVQFNISRQAIADMLNEGEDRNKTLDVVSEIASFTSYSDRNGTLYAAYDLDSVPNNATVGNESTYEDDTEKASPIALTIAEPRQVVGTIFEDNQVANDQNTAEGNGLFDNGNETKLNGVKVDLVYANTNDTVSYINDQGQTVTPTVEINNGDYTITGFIPGEYQVRFTWGDGTTRIDNSLGHNGGAENITVENYKSTVMDYNTYNSENSNRKYYLDTNIMNGRSQAIDNTDTRREIDSSLLNYKHDSDSSIAEIASTTLPMSYGIEYDADELTNVILEGQTIRFRVENVNFGIIRRAEQRMQLDKTVSNFKFTLPTGQVLIDATVDENGNLSGATNYLSYIGDRSNPAGSVIRAEIDESLIQGSQLEITYSLRATNVGQADFLSDDYGYYRFGESYYAAVGQERKNQDIITSSPALIVDYLDESLQYDQENKINTDNEWQLVTLSTDENAEESNKEQLDIAVLNNVLTHKYTDADGNEIDLGNYTIYKTAHLANSNLKPVYSGNDTAESAEVQMVVGQNLNSSRGSSTQNQAEIILVTKPGGGKITQTPGNYIPNKEKQEIDDSISEQVVVIPSTGGNMNYIIPITIGVMACIILGVGVYLIKTKVLKKKDE